VSNRGLSFGFRSFVLFALQDLASGRTTAGGSPLSR